MKRYMAVLAATSAMVFVAGCSAESEPVVIETADVVAQKNAANLEKTVGTETETPATPASNSTPKATPETSVRGALVKRIGEPFGVLREDDTKMIMFTMDSIRRVSAAECPNATNPYITIDDPGAGFAILNLTVTTFDNPPSFPQPLDLYSWYTVNTEGRVTTESGIRMDAMSCAQMDGQDMSNLLPHSTYSKEIVVAIPAGTEIVGYTWTDGVASVEWEWDLPAA